MNVVVAGGGTIAPIDDVRQITNASTGRFSARITEACLERGATVWHIHAPGAELPFDRASRLDLASPDLNRELARLRSLHHHWQAVRDRLHLVPLPLGTVADYSETLERTLRARPVDLVFLVMAVSDYEPDPIPGKIASEAGELVIRCRPTPKVIRSVRDWAPDAYLVGFKLLSHVDPNDLIAVASASCSINRTNLTVANDLQTLRAGRHTIHLVRPGHPSETYSSTEGPIADRLVDRVLTWAGRDEVTLNDEDLWNG